MQHARPLPSYLVQRYHGWKATTWTENRPLASVWAVPIHRLL